MGTWATASDITNRYDDTTPDATIETWIVDAEAYLLSRVPDLAARIADGRTTAHLARLAVCNAVIRHMINPDRHVSQTVGNESHRYSSVAALGLRPANEDLQMLGVPTPATPAIGSITTTLPAHRRPHRVHW